MYLNKGYNMKKAVLLIIAVSSMIFASSGAELVKTKGCTACHAVMGTKAAPAFTGIAKKNIRFNGGNAKSVIISSIKNGSKGKYPNFANSAMPSYASLSDDELNLIADYILEQANNRGINQGKGRGQGRGMGKGLNQ